MPTSPLLNFLSQFTVLRGAIRELWFIYLIKVLEILAYALMNSTLVLWLSSDLGYSDASAGFIVTAWSMGMTAAVILVGPLSDALGVRTTFLLGFSICILSRAVMAFASAKAIIFVFGLAPLVLGVALMTPIMTASVRLFTTTSQRSMAFSVYYALMNLGFAIAGFLFDFLRKNLGEYGHYSLPVLHIELSTYQTIFFLSFLLTIPGLIVSLFGIRPGVRVLDDESLEQLPPNNKKITMEFIQDSILSTLVETKKILYAVWRNKNFYRFLLFLSFVVFVRLIFFHTSYTFPKFGIRTLGEGAPVGQLFGMLNPILIIILVPIVGALTRKISAYRMILFGTTICALSVFMMVIPISFLQPYADGALGNFIGHTWLNLEGPIHPYYISIVLFMTLLSIGEAFYSPRLYEYTASIAPKGQEASYLSLAQLPFFVAKLIGGGLSGVLLTAYCPATGEQNPEKLWLIIAGMTTIAPVGLVVFKRWIQNKEAGRGLED